MWPPYLDPTTVHFAIIIYLHLIPFNSWTAHDKSLYSTHFLQKQSTTWLNKLLSHNWFVLLCDNQVPIDHTVISLTITTILWIALYYFSFVGEKDESETGRESYRRSHVQWIAKWTLNSDMSYSKFCNLNSMLY